MNNEIEVPTAYLVTGGDNPTVSIYLADKPYIIAGSHPNFEAIREKVNTGQWEGLRSLISFEEKAKEELASHGLDESNGIAIRNGEAYLNGYRLGGVLAQRLVERAEKGWSITALSNFAAKLYKNPSKTSVSELYLFIEKADMPICEDGDFLAYKVVRHDYLDCHTGTISNAVGEIVAMPRFEVDDNRNNLCSSGLHFCSYAYLSTMTQSTKQDYTGKGKRVVVVKINPSNVVSVPADYQNTKGRTCEYEVISELTDWSAPVLEGTDGYKWQTREQEYLEDDDFDDDEDCCFECGDSCCEGECQEEEDEFEEMLEDELEAETEELNRGEWREVKYPWL